jgi:tetratricopeptide (TPR) repeat protein
VLKEHEYAAAAKGRFKKPERRGKRNCANLRCPRQAIRLDPKSAAALANRGIAYETKGDYARAVPDFDEAIRLQPGNADFWNSRCWARAVGGQQLQQALADCNEALRLAPRRADTLDSRAFVYLKLGDLGKSIADYDAALKLNPQFVSSLYGRGVAKQRKGDRTGANADIAAAKAIRPTIADEFATYGIR